jgi:hypothetical protein
MDLVSLKPLARSVVNFVKTPTVAKIASIKDLRGLPSEDPGPATSIQEAIKWLERAQDNSSTQDGGVARHYSYINHFNSRNGWGPSYPETTGYIIPTIIRHAKEHNDEMLMRRAEKMLDWLVSIQFPEGGFQAGTIDAKPVVPCTFNTGQILLGLAAGVCEFGDRYKKAMKKAADWLVRTQDSDGCWRKFPTPFAEAGEKAYETHVAWGLLEAADADNNEEYLAHALSNVHWALQYQRNNGWFEKCCLSDPSKPLTHTIGYVFRGILEAYLRTNDQRILTACERIANGLLEPLRKDGFLPGRLTSDWKGAVSWACLTGSVQIAYCWFSLYQVTGKDKYLDAALSANRFVRKTQNTSGPEEIRGAIKGSFPVFGDYGKYEFLNWSAKFFIDSNKKELEIMNGKTMHTITNR